MKDAKREQYPVTLHRLNKHFGIPTAGPHYGYRRTLLERDLSLIDHEYIERTVWPGGDEQWTYVTEPYGASGDELAEFIERCRMFGLTVHVSSGAKHNEGCVRITAETKRRFQ